MIPVRTAGVASRIAMLLYALAVVALPITGLTGVEALGELKGVASVYILLLAALAFGVSTPLSAVEVPRVIVTFFAILVAWIGLDAALNYELIATATLQDRSGGMKFATSAMVVAFGMMVTLLSAHLLRGPDGLRALFLRPLSIGVLICAVFAVPELLTWISPAGTPIYNATTALFHTLDSEQGRQIGRLTSIAFEAPDLAYYSSLTIPWLLLSLRLALLKPWQRGRALAVVTFLSGLALAVLSNSRTGFLMLAAIAGSEIAFWIGLRRLRLPATVFATLFAACLLGYSVLVAQQLPAVGASAAASEDVSTITRSALFSAQLSIFADHPALGVGLGQYGFYTPDVLPPWAWSSYEIERFFETRGELPPSFNVFGRIGSELGIPGLVIWFGFWVALVHRIASVAAFLPRHSFALHVNLAVLSSTVCFLVGGISTDAFRRPETWILVAIAGLYAGVVPRVSRIVL
jgi:hypothetical protein